MVHSVELLFDAETDAAVRRLWDDLTDAGVRSLAGSTSPSNRPHVTLSVADHMDDARQRRAASAAGACCRCRARSARRCCSDSGPFTLVRLVIPSAELLALQAAVHEVCLPHMSSGPLPHADPGHWTPHVTLARRVAPDKLADALSPRRMSRDRRGTAVALRHWDGNNRVEHPIAP